MIREDKLRLEDMEQALEFILVFLTVIHALYIAQFAIPNGIEIAQALRITFLPLLLTILFWVAGKLSPRFYIKAICCSLAWTPLILTTFFYGGFFGFLALTGSNVLAALGMVIFFFVSFAVAAHLSEEMLILYVQEQRSTSEPVKKWWCYLLVGGSRGLMIFQLVLLFNWDWIPAVGLAIWGVIYSFLPWAFGENKFTRFASA